MDANAPIPDLEHRVTGRAELSSGVRVAQQGIVRGER
jgi:hypothetical protein